MGVCLGGNDERRNKKTGKGSKMKGNRGKHSLGEAKADVEAEVEAAAEAEPPAEPNVGQPADPGADQEATMPDAVDGTPSAGVSGQLFSRFLSLGDDQFEVCSRAYNQQ